MMRARLLLFLLCGFCLHQSLAQSAGSAAASQNPRPVWLRHILITGNKLTRRSIILRELSVQEARLLPPDTSAQQLLLVNQQRLNNLSLFTDAQLKLDTIRADTADLIISVKERWYIWPEASFSLADRNFNVWWREQHADLSRVNARLAVTHQNFRGNAERLSATVQVGYTQQLGLSYRRPYIDKQQRHGAGIAFLYARNHETYIRTDTNKLHFLRSDAGYIFSQYEGALSWRYRPGYVSTHSLQLRLQHTVAAPALVQENQDFFAGGSTTLDMAELQYRVDANHTDNWNYPMAGSKMVTYATLRAFARGADAQVQLAPELGWYKPLPARLFSSFIFRGRLSFPEQQPYYLRSALGRGSDYVRGYEYYVIDGSHFAIGRASLKFEALNHTFRKLPFRYLPVLPLRLYPKLYGDAGWVKNLQPGTSILNNRWLYTYGAGIDIITGYDFKIRVEYSVNALGQGNWFIHLDSE